jgi:hypothetical protein
MYDWHRMLISFGGHQKRNPPENLYFSNFNFADFFISFAVRMVVVAQLVRALDCGSRGRGFEPRHPPIFFFLLNYIPPHRAITLLTTY